MSVRIPRWFGVPPELFENGIVPKMSESALRLLFYAYWQSDKRSSRRFQATDKEVASDAGVSARSLCNSRILLRELGLLVSSREPGGRYTYEICDPHTGRPYPGDPKAKPAYVKRPKSAENKSQITSSPSAVRTRDEPSHDAIQPSNTDFPFGHNVEPALANIKMEYFNINRFQ